MLEAPPRTLSRPLAIETFSYRMEQQLPIQDRLLLRLLQYPFSRAADLAFALNLSRSTTYRQIMQAQEAGLLHIIYLSWYKNAMCSYLSTDGIERVALLLEVDPAQLASWWGVGETGLLRLLPHLSTCIPLQAFIHAFVAPMPQRFATNGQPATIRWHWVRNYQVQFTTKGKPAILHMDAALVCARRGTPAEETRYMSAFLLLDPGWTGTHDRHLMQRRLEAIFHFRESAQCRRHYQQFPPLLIVTPSLHQQHLWHTCAREVASHLRLAPLKGAVVILDSTATMTLSSAWTLPWRTLGTGAVCRLDTLFQLVNRTELTPGMLAPRPMPERMLYGVASRLPVVVGRYEKRARTLLATLRHTPMTPQDQDSVLSQKKERETIALLSLALSQRHVAVLHILYAHPLLSAEEIGTSMNVQPATILRYLHDLRHTLCVRRLLTPHGHRFHLVERGLRLMATTLHVSVTHVCEIRRTREEQQQPLQQRGLTHLTRQITHTVGIYSFVTQLQQRAQHTPGHQVLWWETGAHCARRAFFDHAWHNLLPDAALAYQITDHIEYYWLEWDEGTMSRRNIAAKLYAYKRYVDARQWSGEYPHPPLLLFVVPDAKQERLISSMVENILKRTPLVVRITTATRLTMRGPMHPIWLPVLPIDPALADLPLADRPHPPRQSWTDFHVSDSHRILSSIEKKPETEKIGNYSASKRGG